MKVNPSNERLKRRYFRFLKESRGRADVTIDHAASAIYHFEQFTGAIDFRKWTPEQAIDYKKHLMSEGARRATGIGSRATLVTKLRTVQLFFRWLADQDGYRTRIKHCDVEFFNPTMHDLKLARARKEKPGPTLEQARHVNLSMPSGTDVELRNRALVACALSTGARVSALMSLKLKHVRTDGLGIDQDAREVRTKQSKTQSTAFFPVGEDIRRIFLDYVDHLRLELKWGANDPLFPATWQTVGPDHQFRIAGLKPVHWKTAEPVRTIFRRAFASAGIPYFSPHTFRNCLAILGEEICSNPLELKAWSQNLGHDDILTTMTIYGTFPFERQADLILGLGKRAGDKLAQLKALLNDPEVSALLRGANRE